MVVLGSVVAMKGRKGKKTQEEKEKDELR